jgi:hypothetical protein
MGCEWERAKEELTSLQKSDSSYVIVTRFRVWSGSAKPSGILVDGASTFRERGRRCSYVLCKTVE